MLKRVEMVVMDRLDQLVKKETKVEMVTMVFLVKMEQREILENLVLTDSLVCKAQLAYLG